MGMRVPIFLLLLGLFNWAVPKFGSEFIANLFVNKALYYGIGLSDLTYIGLVCLQIFIFPLFLRIHLCILLILSSYYSLCILQMDV